MFEAREPFHTLLLAYGLVPALSSFAVIIRWSYPGLHAQHAQRQALGRYRKQTVHHEPTQIVTGATAHSFGRAKMRQIEFGRVLHGQYDGHLLHVAKCLTDMRSEHPVRINLPVVEAAVRGLELGAIKRLRERALRA